MKKVVLLAGAVAAGMAVAPQAANAAAPEINEVQEINGGVSEADAYATKAQADAKIVELRNVLDNYQLTTDLKNQLKTIISHLQSLSDECVKCFDSVQNSGSFGEVGDGESDWPNGQLISEQWPSCVDNVSWLAPYKSYKGGLNAYSNLVDVYDLQKAKADEVMENVRMYVNGLLQTKIQATTNYQQLNNIITEAEGIIKDTKDIYTDQDGTTTFKDLKDQILDATATDGAYRSAVNLKTKIDGLGSIKNEYVSEFELMTDLGIVTPNLEGAISTFKKKATEAALTKINALEDSEQTRLQEIIDDNLTHHKASSLCKNLTGHDITNETGYTTAQSDLSTYLTSLQTDLTDWNAKEASQRATSDPLAITLWYDIQKNNTNTFDTDVTAIETAIYKACLKFDKADIEKAIEELGSSTVLSAYKNTLKDSRDGDNNQKANVESQLADWLDTFFNALGNTSLTSAKSDYITGSVAEKYWDTFNEYGSKSTYANLQAKTEVSYTEFRGVEAAIDKLAKTIDNIKTNWSNIQALDKDLVELRLDIEVAKKKNGYGSNYITGLWGTNAAEASTSSTGEYKELFALRENVYNAIIAINDKDATAASNGKAGEWVGKASFETQIALENDHHDWLAKYQQENYQAKEDMLAAIKVRKAEYDAVSSFAITSDDPENPMKLADNTELYTTDTNKGVSLINILGEETTTKYIYKVAFFNELLEHFGNDDGTVNTASIVTDGKPVDLMEDRITKWYNDGEAQYIVGKTYATAAGWATATERKGELVNNTVEGLLINTDASDASGILVMNPAKTTTGNEVVFGWLQKEIQNAFAKAVENEKANKDLHEAREAVEKYITDAQNDIDTYAQLNFNASAKDINVYKIDTRTDVPYTEPAINFVGKIDHDGAATGVTNYNVVALADTYYKEGGNVDPTAATVDYKSITGCGHEPSSVWGWTVIGTNMTELQKLEKKEYDKIASKKLLDGTTPYTDTDSQSLTYDETLTKVKENVDDITNEAYTQMVRNGLAYVQQTLNDAKVWAKGVDGVCDETQCATLDITNNPCGWDAKTPQDALKQIIADWNEQLTNLGTAHNAETADNHKTAEDNFLKFQAYVTKALADVRDWQVKFAEADKAHKQALNAALDLAESEAHTVHHYSFDAKSAMANFKKVDGDLAAANLWAEKFNARVIGTYDGKKVTFQEFVKNIDEKAVALDPSLHTQNPDKYAAIKTVATSGITSFQDYINATEFLKEFLESVAKAYYQHHQYTELKKLADGIKDFNWEADFMVTVEANRTAKAALLAKVEKIKNDVEIAKDKSIADSECKNVIANKFTEFEKDLTKAETAVNNAFTAGDATTATETVDALTDEFAKVLKEVEDINFQVRASHTAATDMKGMINAAFNKETGAKIKEAQVTGYENFKERSTDPDAITKRGVTYFDEIEVLVQKLIAEIDADDAHKEDAEQKTLLGHTVAINSAKYLQTMDDIQKDLDKLVQAIKDNETAHNAQIEQRNKLYKKYECYDTTGLEAAVNDIAPDFSLDTEFPEVPGYPETKVEPEGKDHTKAHTAVADAIKALDAEIKKHYENGASNVEAAKTLIGEKETAYTTAFEHAQTNDSKFMEEYGKCKEADKDVVPPTPVNWMAAHFENGANKYSDEANVQVTKAYNEMVAARKAYLADIKTDWYNNEVAEKVANNEGLLNTYKEKITAYKAAVEKAQKNDQEFDKQLAAHVVKPLTAEATYTDTRVTDDPTYVDLKAQLTALYPECNNVETDSKYNTIRKQIIQDWEDEKSALNGTAEAVAAYQAAAQKYNELMANLNAYGSQLVKYLQQSDAFDEAKTTIAGYDIMTSDLKDFDGNTEGAQDYNHKKDIEKAINTINGKLNTLYGDMKTEANHVAETINDTDLTNNEVNDLYVDPAVGTIKTLIENLAKDAKKYEDACDANEAAFEPLHDNIKTVEADYAEGSAKVTALPEPAQEAFNLAVKEDLQALAGLQEDLEEAYMAENAAAFTKDNTDYEDLKKEIEEMYDRAVQAGANLGDIDGVDGITVYDSDALVDIVLYNRGYAVRGDFDFNGENDVTDVERLNNLLWYKHIEKAWAPGRVAFEGDIELTAEGNTVALALNNNVQTNGIQFDVTVPEGAYIQNVLGTDRVEGMRVLTACIADNTYRVLVISTLNASTINGNEGAIVTFNVAGGSEVEVSNVIATDGSSHRLNGAAVSVGVTTDINEIASEGETDIFTLDGIRQSVMKAGVNIVRGANGVAKKIFNK